MVASAKIIGEKRFRRKMQNLPKDVRKKLKKMMNDTGNAIVKEVKSSILRSSGKWELSGGHWSSPPGTPPNNNTGKLLNSVRKNKKAVLSELSIDVTANIFYAGFLEFGTRYMEARPFMRPAFRVFSPLFTKAGKKLIKDSVKKVSKNG